MAGDTRERILEVAAELFQDQGFEATTVAAILKRAGVNSGSLYHFFPGKDALLVGVLHRYVEILPATLLEPAHQASPDPLGRVFALLDVYRRRLVVSECRRGCPVGALAAEIGHRNEQARRVIEEYFRLWTERVREWLAEAEDRLPADLDREALARLALAVMEGGVVQARAAAEIAPFDAAVEGFRRYVELLVRTARRASEGTAVGTERPGEVELEGGEPAGEMPLTEETGWRAW